MYLTQRWLPSKKLTLRASTYDSYRRNLDLHITDAIGRVPLRRLRPIISNGSTPNSPTTAAPTGPVEWTLVRRGPGAREV